MEEETLVCPSELPTAGRVSGSKKKEEKNKKRDPRSWDNVKKATANMTDAEERLKYVEVVFKELFNECKVVTTKLHTLEKQYSQCLRDREKDRAEVAKSILARGQLESLCRELQKQNKLIKDENITRIKEEEDKRREVSNIFTERLNSLTVLIAESKDKSNQVKEENDFMSARLSELHEEYRQRETHLETVTKQLDLQKKLTETHVKKFEIEIEAEKQASVAQKRAFELQLEKYEKDVAFLKEQNLSLEAQIELYKNQYSDFEVTMTKSNKVFDSFKQEMSKMSKQLRALETERNDIKQKWHSSLNSLVELSEKHVALSKEQNALKKREEKLQNLCRQLQEDRSAFLKQLKINNIEPVTVFSKKEPDNKKVIEESKNENNLQTNNENEVMKKDLTLSCDQSSVSETIPSSNPNPMNTINGDKPIDELPDASEAKENSENIQPAVESLSLQASIPSSLTNNSKEVHTSFQDFQKEDQK